jgi:hypothetical protein
MGKTWDKIKIRMTVDELKIKLGSIVSANTKFKVKGYKSSSSEAVHDFELQYVGPGVYKTLVTESLEFINSNKDNVLNKPDGYSDEDWNSAVAEQAESFKASLRKIDEPEEAGDGDKKEPAYAASKEGYLVSTKEADTFAISNCIMLNSVCIAGQTTPKQAKGVRPQLKNILKSRLPISKYTPLLKFTVDKVQDIELS